MHTSARLSFNTFFSFFYLVCWTVDGRPAHQPLQFGPIVCPPSHYYIWKKKKMKKKNKRARACAMCVCVLSREWWARRVCIVCNINVKSLSLVSVLIHHIRIHYEKTDIPVEWAPHSRAEFNPRLRSAAICFIIFFVVVAVVLELLINVITRLDGEQQRSRKRLLQVKKKSNDYFFFFFF